MTGGGADGTARRLALGLGAGAAPGWSAPVAAALADAIPGVRVTALAGRGGMGAVYRGEQTRLGRAVAVKILAPHAAGGGDPLAEERFEREARVLAGLAHPHVLQIFDAGRLADGTRYLVMEWAEGGDLARLTGGRAQPLAQVLGWAEQIAAALDSAHARGVIHRDLKPANVLVRADGRLALGDFGLARAMGAGFTTTLTLSGVAQGTVGYMAPEQAEGGRGGRGGEGAITPAADVFALGVLTHELLTGRVPRGVFTPASEAVAGVPATVDAVIAAALEADPARRTQRAGDFSRELRKAAIGRGRRGKARRVAALAGWGAVAAVVVAAGVALKWRVGPRVQAEEAVAVVAPPREVRPASVVAEDGWRSLLPELDVASVAKRGGWSRRGGELASDGAVCWLALPAEVSADFRYEVELEFTREAGRHSVGVLLPTAAGAGVFELDAWEAGLGGFQMIDGRDLRENGTAFPAALRNGERQRVRIVVEGATVTVDWNGARGGAVELRGRDFATPWLWETGEGGPWARRLGVCTWQSPTVFHRVALQAR